VEVSNGTSVKSYPFSLSSVYFTKFSPNYAGTALSNILTTELAATKNNGLSYIQNGLGIVTKLQIPFLKQNLGSIAINKAFLEITPKKSDYPFSTGLGLVEIDDNNKIIKVSNIDQLVYLDNNSQAATIDTSKKYTLNITRYLQETISKNTAKNFAILPYNYYISSSGSASFIRNTDPRRMVLDANSVKLKVYYTKTEK
jgi:hypothetical protein